MINVGEVVTFPEFAQKFTVIYRGGEWVEGRWVTRENAVRVTGITDPVSGRDLDVLPESDRAKDVRRFYSRSKNQFHVSNEGQISDIIVFKDRRYKLKSVEDYSEFGYWCATGICEGRSV